MGDVLQFVRFLPMVKKRGGTLILEAHQPLIPLLEPLPCIDEIIPFNGNCAPTTVHDLHIPLLSLPRILKTRGNTIALSIPYIQIPSNNSSPWKKYPKPGHLNIGLVWAASELNPKRNLPIDKCCDWFQQPGCHFVSLQTGAAQNQLSTLSGNQSPITMLGSRLNNFKDTAGAMTELDLIISVDTAAAHLAGAMAVPLWVLLPWNADWRWPLNGEQGRWYPKARIFKQSGSGNWNGVIRQVATALRGLQ